MFKVGGVTELKREDFFLGLDWNLLEMKEIDPPQIIALDNEEDLRNFHDEFVAMTIPRSVKEMTKDDFRPNRCASDTFRGFSFVMDDFDLPDRDESEVDHYWNNVDADGMSKSSCASSVFDDQISDVKEPSQEKKKRPPRKKKKNKGKVPNPMEPCLENGKLLTRDNNEFLTINDQPVTTSSNIPDPSNTANEIKPNPSLQTSIQETPLQTNVIPTITMEKVVEPQWQTNTKKQKYVPPKQHPVSQLRSTTYSVSKPYLSHSRNRVPNRSTTLTHNRTPKATVPRAQQPAKNFTKSKPPPPGSWAALAANHKNESPMSSTNQTQSSPSNTPDVRAPPQALSSTTRKAPKSMFAPTSTVPKMGQKCDPFSVKPKLAVQETFWPSLSSPRKPGDGEKCNKPPGLQGKWGSKTKPTFSSTIT